MSNEIFFNGWNGPLRVVLIAPIAYVILVLFLRIAGKRTLTKLNAFDLVITVALGSTLATQILSRDTPILDGALAFAMLIGLQWLVTFTSVRVRWFRTLVRSEPTVLFADGTLRQEALRRERITESELLQGVRASGSDGLDQVDAVYLQTDGSLAAVTRK